MKKRQLQSCRAPRRRLLKESKPSHRLGRYSGPNFGCILVQQSHEFRHTNHLQVYPYVDLPSSSSTRLRLLTDITRKDAKGMRKHVSHLRVPWQRGLEYCLLLSTTARLKIHLIRLSVQVESIDGALRTNLDTIHRVSRGLYRVLFPSLVS
jgi:hypothetical protein